MFLTLSIVLVVFLWRRLAFCVYIMDEKYEQRTNFGNQRTILKFWFKLSTSSTQTLNLFGKHSIMSQWVNMQCFEWHRCFKGGKTSFEIEEWYPCVWQFSDLSSSSRDVLRPLKRMWHFTHCIRQFSCFFSFSRDVFPPLKCHCARRITSLPSLSKPVPAVEACLCGQFNHFNANFHFDECFIQDAVGG